MIPCSAPHTHSRVVCILGPTGSGKNDLALDLCRFYSSQIINFDSRQVYRGLPIVTAQPGPDDMRKCPHHLYGFLNPAERMSAGRFVKLASERISAVSAKGCLPLLVGGTGLYLRALIHGLAFIPQVPEKVRAQLQSMCAAQGPEALHKKLEAIDPEYAQKISSKDRQRITRALEVYQATGRTLTQWHGRKKLKPGLSVLKLGMDVEWERLVKSLRFRIEQMLARGAVEEVRSVWAENAYDRNLPALTGIGCRELLDYLEGRLGLNECIEEWFKSTRNYAKRQLTWFRKEPEVHWIRPDQTWEAVRQIQVFLSH